MYCLRKFEGERSKCILPPLSVGSEQEAVWIDEFGLLEASVKPFTRVCSRHFRNGDPANGPDKTLGARFASPKKRGTSRAQRATKRALSSQLQSLHSQQPSQHPLPATQLNTPDSANDIDDDLIDHQITAAVGEPLRTDYEVHEFFSEDPSEVAEVSAQIRDKPTSHNIPEPVGTFISVALTARIEVLEAENQRLHKSINASKDKPCLRIEHIAGDDKLVRLYTGFISYMILINFFHFFGTSCE